MARRKTGWPPADGDPEDLEAAVYGADGHISSDVLLHILNTAPADLNAATESMSTLVAAAYHRSEGLWDDDLHGFPANSTLAEDIWALPAPNPKDDAFTGYVAERVARLPALRGMASLVAGGTPWLRAHPPPRAAVPSDLSGSSRAVYLDIVEQVAQAKSADDIPEMSRRIEGARKLTKRDRGILLGELRLREQQIADEHGPAHELLRDCLSHTTCGSRDEATVSDGSLLALTPVGMLVCPPVDPLLALAASLLRFQFRSAAPRLRRCSAARTLADLLSARLHGREELAHTCQRFYVQQRTTRVYCSDSCRVKNCQFRSQVTEESVLEYARGLASKELDSAVDAGLVPPTFRFENVWEPTATESSAADRLTAFRKVLARRMSKHPTRRS